MVASDELKNEVRALLIAELMLKVEPDQILDDTPLFGAGGLGLDSVDALQLVVALEKRYGLKISDTEVARETLKTVESISAAVRQHRAGGQG
jgi:acyl carrier protein